jgi:UDP-N-acetylmuramate--alanine ligase
VRLQKAVYTRAELLAMICAEFPNVIAVAGSHGKTTCTSMCAHIFQGLNAPFTAHIGGEDSALGNYCSLGEEYFLTEACEYKKNLLKIPKRVAVVLNVDKDHMECYDGEKDLEGCFYQFCEQAETAFVCADDEKCKLWGGFQTFSIQNPLADYRAIDLRSVGERYSFTVEEYGKPLCRVRLNAVGRCNVYNALAAFAAARSFGFDGESIARGLATFAAVKRRFEKIGECRGVSFICDYAHHPREILSTLATTKGLAKKNVYVIFQPHTYSRTKLLMEDFISVLRPIKNLMIYKTYPAREPYDAGGSAEYLAERVGSLYANSIYALKIWLKSTVRENDVVLFLGAGDIYYTAQYLLKELQ